MKITIELEVDDTTGSNFQHLNEERKQKIIGEVRKMLENTVCQERTAQLKKILEELQSESGGMDIDPEILYEIMRGEND